MKEINYDKTFKLKEFREVSGWDFSEEEENCFEEAKEILEEEGKPYLYQELEALSVQLFDRLQIHIRILKNEVEERAYYEIGYEGEGWGNTVAFPFDCTPEEAVKLMQEIEESYNCCIHCYQWNKQC